MIWAPKIRAHKISNIIFQVCEIVCGFVPDKLRVSIHRIEVDFASIINVTITEFNKILFLLLKSSLRFPRYFLSSLLAWWAALGVVVKHLPTQLGVRVKIRDIPQDILDQATVLRHSEDLHSSSINKVKMSVSLAVSQTPESHAYVCVLWKAPLD